MSNIAVDLLLGAISTALDSSVAPVEKSMLTPDVGALVRDKGVHTALEAARIRRSVGFLCDVANCAEYVLPKHRRRLNR